MEDSGHSQYDVIVVGSGLGGLTAAALLAKAGRSVLVLEKDAVTGGFAAGFEWRGSRFDTALHVIMGLGRPSPGGHGIITDVLQELGVSDQCEFIRLDPFYRAVFPELDVTVSGGGRCDYVDSLCRHFPAQRSAIERLMTVSARIHQETLRFPVDPRPWQKLLVPVRFPGLFRNMGLTLDGALERHGIDADAGAVLGALWLYLGLPPSRVSFLVWAAMTANMVDEGAYYCRGGFQRLAEALTDGVRRHGGEVRTETAVRRIVVTEGRVQGVVTAAGDTVRAPVVISNVDARLTVRELVGEERFPASYRDKVERMRPSIFVVALYASAPHELVPSAAVHETALFSSRDHEATYADGLVGRISGATLTIPTITDPSVAADGSHLIVIKAMIPADPGLPVEDAPRQLAECVAPVLPDLPGFLGVGPDSPQGDRGRYALKTLGPIYGWERSPDQIGPYGLGNATPIEGLYLCGHWSQPGAGVRTVVISGKRVCRLITGEQTSRGIIG